jgi:hypothetical protein
MPGGQYDSSKTRVVPVFESLKRANRDWIRELLSLAEGPAPSTRPRDADFTFVNGHWGEQELGLQPPVALLSWLVRNLARPMNQSDLGDDDVGHKRQRLIDRDPATIAAGLELLRSTPAERAWYILEGRTYPDAFIETPDALVVVEGKRSEAGPTTDTTWMAGRHQVWRHIDAAWEIRGRRAVYGLFIVEGDAGAPEVVPQVWQQAVRDALAEKALAGSFPHRGAAERSMIAEGFLGAVTWQRVCQELWVDRSVLIERA